SVPPETGMAVSRPERSDFHGDGDYRDLYQLRKLRTDLPESGDFGGRHYLRDQSRALHGVRRRVQLAAVRGRVPGLRLPYRRSGLHRIARSSPGPVSDPSRLTSHHVCAGSAPDPAQRFRRREAASFGYSGGFPRRDQARTAAPPSGKEYGTVSRIG